MVNIEIDEKELALILNALAEKPFRQVAPLIQKIDIQVTNQLKSNAEIEDTRQEQ